MRRGKIGDVVRSLGLQGDRGRRGESTPPLASNVGSSLVNIDSRLANAESRLRNIDCRLNQRF
jgi:hypothetical protein